MKLIFCICMMVRGGEGKEGREGTEGCLPFHPFLPFPAINSEMRGWNIGILVRKSFYKFFYMS
jgi:hypothetical protein